MPRASKSLLNPTEFAILLAIADEPRHGYGIVQEVERSSRGTVKLGPGTLYGAVKRMLESGLLEESAATAKHDDPRRSSYYRLSRTGRALVREQAQQLADLVQTASTKGLINLNDLLAQGDAR
jgi:DNA-binding PadR family transcriptional regulator